MPGLRDPVTRKGSVEVLVTWRRVPKGRAMRASTMVSLLGFLLVASRVGSGHASSPRTSGR